MQTGESFPWTFIVGMSAGSSATKWISTDGVSTVNIDTGEGTTFSWRDVVFLYDRATTTMSAYVDGVLITSDNAITINNPVTPMIYWNHSQSGGAALTTIVDIVYAAWKKPAAVP
jgi:hypothetical protein